jgi:tRNA(His) 5'-end guanylyltransferase
MTFNSLAERQKSYEKPYDYTLTKNLPLIIRVNGRSFTKLTKKLNKPFDTKLDSIFNLTTLYTLSELQNCVFAYSFSDEVTFIINSSTDEYWYNNRIQKIISVVSSLFTLTFYKYCLAHELDFNDPVFDARIFALPSVEEVINNLIWRQNDCLNKSLMATSIFHLQEKLGMQKCYALLENKTNKEKQDLLIKYCGINFEDNYPSEFYLGNIYSKNESIINGSLKTKWISAPAPNFVLEKKVLEELIKHH